MGKVILGILLLVAVASYVFFLYNRARYLDQISDKESP